jgi:hypothetical protein
MIEYVALNGIERELWEVDYENKAMQYLYFGERNKRIMQ